MAAEGIPILVAGGDRWLLEETEEGELGTARKVVTKEGLGRARARSVAPAAAHAHLQEAIAEAMAGPRQPPPVRSYPAELMIRVEGEEIARTAVADPADLRTEIANVFRAPAVSREYRQLAKLLPSDHASRLRSAQRRAGSLLATPVMRRKERDWLAAAA